MSVIVRLCLGSRCFSVNVWLWICADAELYLLFLCMLAWSWHGDGSEITPRCLDQ